MDTKRIPVSTSKASALLEQRPFDTQLWVHLARSTRAQNDYLSTHSVESILLGLRELNKKKIVTQEPDFTPSFSARTLFIRLARSYNNPKLLKEAGLLFFQDWQLPAAALRLFECSMRLGGTEQEIKPFADAASRAIEQSLEENKDALPHAGVSIAQHTQTLAGDAIRKSGPLMIRGALGHISLPPVEEERIQEVVLPKTSKACLEQGLAAIAEGQLKKASLLLLKVDNDCAEKDKLLEAWSQLGAAAFDAGRSEEMKTAYGKALEFDQSSLSSHFNYALALHLNQDLDQAETYYLSANRIQPDHPKTWCNLGTLYFQQKDYTKAEIAFSRCLHADPAYARAWDNLASALGAQNKLRESREACQQAVDLRPGFPEAYFKLGVIDYYDQNWGMAITAFQHALKLPLLAASSHAFLAMIQARMNQIQRAEATVQKASEAEPTCELLETAWVEIGKAYFRAQSHSQAEKAFQEAAFVGTEKDEAWLHLGLLHHTLGDGARALEYYQKATTANPRLYGAWHNLGTLHAEEERYNDAANCFRKVVEITPRDIRAWEDLAHSLERAGLRQEASVARDHAITLT